MKTRVKSLQRKYLQKEIFVAASYRIPVVYLVDFYSFFESGHDVVADVI